MQYVLSCWVYRWNLLQFRDYHVSGVTHLLETIGHEFVAPIPVLWVWFFILRLNDASEYNLIDFQSI